jgi:hypothetical protein
MKRMFLHCRHIEQRINAAREQTLVRYYLHGPRH